MLHDPRHDKTPSMASFALFVASKDPDEKYDWSSCQNCAVGQYLQSIGQYRSIGSWDGAIRVMNDLACGKPAVSKLIFDPKDWTFGKLADRILAYQMGELKLA